MRLIVSETTRSLWRKSGPGCLSPVLFAPIWWQGLFFHPVLSDQVFILAQLEEVHILVPEVCICAFIAIASHLVEDAEVRHDLHRVELIANLLKQLLLLLCEQIFVDLVVATHGEHIAIVVRRTG